MVIILHHIKRLWHAALRTLVPLILCTLGAAANAQDAAAISQGFQTQEPGLVTGAMVSFSVGHQGVVQLADVSNANQLAGVVGDKPLIEIKSTNNKEVQVVTSGITPVLVSDINGDVKSGDKITPSPLEGVGMKAVTSAQVVGTAQTDFSNIHTVQKAITDRSGKPQTVHTGLLPVQINVTYYSPDDKKTLLPPFLQQIAFSIAGGRTVSTGRILGSSLALLLGFVSIATLLYSSVRSSIIAIGRNPLSEGAVHKSLVEVGVTAIGILLVMIIAIYLILRT